MPAMGKPENKRNVPARWVHVIGGWLLSADFTSAILLKKIILEDRSI